MAFASLTTACASIPSSGPSARQLFKSEKAQADAIGFSILDVSAESLPAPELSELTTTAALEQLASSGRVDLLGPGDILQVNIYEVGVSLFGSGVTLGGGDRGTTNVSVKDQAMEGVTVDDDGYISLPYIGRIRAAGRTTEDVRRAIIAGLRGKSQAPQALVTVKENVTNTVTVGGLVAQPGRQRVSLARERILDAVAAAGGLKEPANQSTAILRFTRAGRTVETYLSELTPGSTADLQLLGGDRVEILQRDRSFTVFGAAGRVSEIKFEKAGLSLSDAVARAGGPDGQQADPAGIFVFRYEKDAGTPNVEKPLVYRLDMTKPSSYFLSQRFMMRDRDVIYVANASSVQTRKLVEIFSLFTSPLIQARAVTR
ncbi:polysaccharide biosynthesis/export family protein [Sphingobium sp. HBC34]|uniref:Polysaccharide biosynthesis/export family protein n=1 Tax=Sphingobium cyanobacteriorum TaxID=3063954 RepID=A0ABT8ZNB2_9SPHN|nr:polysaccharide biosynthesis/export family protein [Sphingobium sp. HBC34]MDO7836024.1 polysaccharide biosynthesis/export family protein [Sphingobium sp. HBC34]